MKINVSAVFLLISIFGRTQNSPKYSLESNVLGTRQSIVHSLSLQISYNKLLFELALGYELGRAVQYRYLSPNLMLGFGHQLMQQKKMDLFLKSSFLRQWRQFPSNKSLVSNGLYFGYSYVYGRRIKFIQSLQLGILHNQAASGLSIVTHDFLISFGVRYLFQKNNILEK